MGKGKKNPGRGKVKVIASAVSVGKREFFKEERGVRSHSEMIVKTEKEKKNRAHYYKKEGEEVHRGEEREKVVRLVKPRGISAKKGSG